MENLGSRTTLWRKRSLTKKRRPGTVSQNTILRMKHAIQTHWASAVSTEHSMSAPGDCGSRSFRVPRRVPVRKSEMSCSSTRSKTSSAVLTHGPTWALSRSSSKRMARGPNQPMEIYVHGGPQCITLTRPLDAAKTALGTGST